MRHNRKVSVLRKRLGLSGYALWCLVLETLSGAEGYAVRWSEAEAELFAEEYDVEPDVLRTFLDFCLKHGMLIYNKEQGTLACPALMERFAEAEERTVGLASKRAEAGRKGMQRRWAKENAAADDNKTITSDNKDNKSAVCYASPITSDNKTITNDNKTAKDDFCYNKNNIDIDIEYNNDDDDGARVHTCEGEAEPNVEADPALPAADVEAARDAAKPVSVAAGGNTKAYVRLLLKETSWTENVCTVHKLPRDGLEARLDEFVRECIVNGRERHTDMSDVKQHFNSWLRIRLAAERKAAKQQQHETDTLNQRAAQRAKRSRIDLRPDAPQDYGSGF